jgi:hypothetical protein
MSKTIKPHPDDLIHLFWTGGYDSTFRLLQILLLEKKSVQTYYIIDKGRRSLPNELEAMFKISHTLITAYEHTRALFLPTRFYWMNHIKPDTEITSAYHAAKQGKVISPQYEYMARFCKQHKINRMELSVEHLVNPTDPLRFQPYIQRIGDSQQFSLREDIRGQAEYVLYHYFHFPIYGYSKVSMAKEVKAQGWEQIMDMTWFCQKPIRGKYPCGQCAPCQQYILEGMGSRIPLRNRIYSRIKQSKYFTYLNPLAEHLDKRLN